MPYHDFPVIILALQSQGNKSSASSIRPKKQAASLESRIWIEATPASLSNIFNTGYTSIDTIHPPSHHDAPTRLPWATSSNGVGCLQVVSETQELDASEQQLHPLAMRKVHPCNCQLDPNWQCSPSAPPQCDNLQTNPAYLHDGLMTTLKDFELRPPTCLRSQGHSDGSQTSNFAHATTQLSWENYQSICWFRKSRRRKNRTLLSKMTKTLDTIPEHQEWKNQEKCRNNLFKCIKNENLELKSVFENDSDSDDE